MTDPKAIALESFRLIETGEAELAQRIIAPDYVNAEADDDPDDAGRRLPGPAGLLATSQWLRDAFSDLRFELHETVAEEGVVMAAATMTGVSYVAFGTGRRAARRTGLTKTRSAQRTTGLHHRHYHPDRAGSRRRTWPDRRHHPAHQRCHPPARPVHHYLVIFDRGKALALYHTKRLASPRQRIMR